MRHVLTIFLLLIGAGLIVGGVLMSKGYPHAYGWLIALGIPTAALGLVRAMADT